MHLRVVLLGPALYERGRGELLSPKATCPKHMAWKEGYVCSFLSAPSWLFHRDLGKGQCLLEGRDHPHAGPEQVRSVLRAGQGCLDSRQAFLDP